MRKANPIFWKLFFHCWPHSYCCCLLINKWVFGPLPSLKELENPSIMLASEVLQMMAR